MPPVVRFRTGIRVLCVSSLVALVAGSAAPALSRAAESQPSGTIGLVVTDWRYDLYETADKSECPAGLQVGEATQFKARPHPLERLKKWGAFQNRGPNGENANYSPLAVEDALPFHELKTKVGYGMNLDGTSDGHATDKTCKHEKFTNPEGEQVDNQMARVLGCVMGWRTTGFMAEFYSNEIDTRPINRHLIEITGVDDAKNDPDVEVHIYKGRDRLVRSASGSFIPFISNRIDARFPQFMSSTHGKIVDGVLITDPIPLARFPLHVIEIPGERRMRDVRLRLKLTDTGAEGVLAGYEILDTWWNMHSKGPGVGTDIGRYSPAALYRAAHRYADGFPDPETGQCTAISTTYKISAVRAMIVHEPQQQSDSPLERKAMAPQPNSEYGVAEVETK